MPRPKDQSRFENKIVFVKGLLVAGLSPTSLIATGALVLYDNFVLSTYEEFMHCLQATSNCFVKESGSSPSSSPLSPTIITMKSILKEKPKM